MREILFKENLKYLIRSRGLSATAIAAECGIKASNLYDYMKGSRLPRLNILVKLQEYFGVTLDELTFGLDFSARLKKAKICDIRGHGEVKIGDHFYLIYHFTKDATAISYNIFSENNYKSFSAVDVYKNLVENIGKENILRNNLGIFYIKNDVIVEYDPEFNLIK